MKKIIITITVLAAVLSAQAALTYSTDFSTGYVDGPVRDHADWSGNHDSLLVDATTGIATNNRASDATMYLTTSSAMAVNDMWTFTSVLATESANNFHEAFQIGISTNGVIDDSIGVALFSTSGAWDMTRIGAGDQGDSSAVASLSWAGSTYVTSVVTIARSSTANEFDITASFNGNAAVYTETVTNAAFYAAGSYHATWDLDENDKTSAFMDSVGIATTVVPEPATIGMLGLGAFVTMLVRRFRRG